MYINIELECSIEEQEGKDAFGLGYILEEKCAKVIEEHMNTLICPCNELPIENISVYVDAWDEVL